jgi:SAM-dependent methyltransferase
MSADAPAASSSLRRRVASLVPADVKDLARPAARRVGLAAPAEGWWQEAAAVWKGPKASERHDRWCNVCRWTGSAFLGSAHTESAKCPRCGSVARDRFLLWCFTSRTGKWRDARVIETSPRLGAEYREYMRRWFSYRTSDFDLSMHRGDVQLDLQDIDLPDASVDIVLTPHVLEHVPDTDRALAELFRVIAPGGRMYLQVPLLQGVTAPPTEPEFHADNTPVLWRFGWDLVDRLRAAGFTATTLVTAEFEELLRGDLWVPEVSGEFDVASIVEHVRGDDLTVVADTGHSRLMGFEPGFQFVTWECLRPDSEPPSR